MININASDLVGLYDAMYEIEKLKDDIMEISARLKKLQNEELNNIIRKIDELISVTYWFAAAHTKIIEVHYILFKEGKRVNVEKTLVSKDSLNGEPERFNTNLEDNISKIEMYIGANKNVIDEKYEKEIKNYIALLRKFGEVFARFIAELTKDLDLVYYAFK
ncbi:MAG: hypothetical protein QW046_03450 [Candidatus Micrarchaeaceae archaeon]